MNKSQMSNSIMMKKQDNKQPLLIFNAKKESIHLKTELFTVGNGWEGIGMDTENRPGQMARNTRVNG